MLELKNKLLLCPTNDHYTPSSCGLEWANYHQKRFGFHICFSQLQDHLQVFPNSLFLALTGILDRVNHAVLPFKDEFAEVFKELQEIGSEIRGVENLIALVVKEKIELDLKNEGVQFEKGRNVQLKFNYSPNVVWIKLTDVSKSGKKGTAVFKWALGGATSREENINVSSIIDQVYGLRNDIVQHTSAE